MIGILNLHKPTRCTSRDVVNRVQRVLRDAGAARNINTRKLKVGHAGTLDPLASGVLVVCVGAATRLIEYVQRQPKSYRGEFLLGQCSPSDDVESEVAPLPDAPQPSRAQLAAALPQFLGRIEQRPPAYSAIKVQGQRSYDLARRGELLELAARPVDVHRLEIVDYTYPRLTLDIDCGSGTYVRSLGRDLAAAVGTAAVMSALVRTAIGPFRLNAATAPDLLTPENLDAHLQPAAVAVAKLPSLVVDQAEIAEIRQGRFLSIPPHLPVDAAEIAALSASGDLIALLAPRPDGQLGPTKVFADTPFSH